MSERVEVQEALASGSRSDRRWVRLAEPHASGIVLTWPDGRTTRMIATAHARSTPYIETRRIEPAHSRPATAVSTTVTWRLGAKADGAARFWDGADLRQRLAIAK